MKSSRATVRLGLDCNNRCIFCAQDGLSGKHADDVGTALESARAQNDEVTFVGGEPTLDPHLVDDVRAARSLGFRRVGLQTNGRLLDAALASRFADAGLTDVHLSLHGAEAAVHDYHTGVEGSFEHALGAIRASRAAGLVVVAATVLTRSNFRVLSPIPRLLHGAGVAAWLVEVALPAGRGADAHDRIVPPLGLAGPFALHALEASGALGLPAWIRGAPTAVLGPFASRAFDAEPGDFPELRRLFVGVGPLAARSATTAVREARDRGRVALPVLGKVKPARAEVASGSERRTGEALREILPALFDDEPKG